METGRVFDETKYDADSNENEDGVCDVKELESGTTAGRWRLLIELTMELDCQECEAKDEEFLKADLEKSLLLVFPRS